MGRVCRRCLRVGALGWTGHMSIEAPIEPSSGHRTLLADGTVVLVRRLDPADREVDAVVEVFDLLVRPHTGKIGRVRARGGRARRGPSPR